MSVADAVFLMRHGVVWLFGNPNEKTSENADNAGLLRQFKYGTISEIVMRFDGGRFLWKVRSPERRGSMWSSAYVR